MAVGGWDVEEMKDGKNSLELKRSTEKGKSEPWGQKRQDL